MVTMLRLSTEILRLLLAWWIYYAYASVQSVITYDRLGRCFRFVYINACIAVFFALLLFLGE